MAEAISNNLLVIGAGSWGTALAIVLAKNGHTTFLWGRDSEHIKNLQTDRMNQRFLPKIPLPENCHPVDSFSELAFEVDDVILAVPCAASRSILENVKQYFQRPLRICLTSKGLEPEHHRLGHELVEEIFAEDNISLVLSGPSFAEEVAKGLPTAVTIASQDKQAAEDFAAYFRNDHFRTYTNNDVIGVEVGGAVKNVMAIAAGIADGLGFGANARAALITRGLAEITRLAIKMGAQSETFLGLAGLGDLVLTCTDNLSRNRRFGLALAEGKTIEQAQEEIGEAIEGINTAKEICLLANKLDIEMPISEQVLKVINGDCAPEEAVKNLLQREPKAEMN